MDDTILTDGNADSDGAATDMIVMATPGLSRHQRALFRSAILRAVRRPIVPALTDSGA